MGPAMKKPDIKIQRSATLGKSYMGIKKTIIKQHKIRTTVVNGVSDACRPPAVSYCSVSMKLELYLLIPMLRSSRLYFMSTPF